MEIFGENRPDLWAARNWLKFPRVTPQPGAIVVLKRGTSPNAGHVGIVVSIDANGNPVVKSGNHRQRVAVSTYPRNQVIAYVKI
jgi:surface antigen